MSATTTTTEPTVARPETYRLPRPGKSDPFFGFSRSFYYAAEKRGWLKLIRIRLPGKEKGVTLIPYRDVEAFITAHIEEEKTT
jgi:hypothetical protein